MNYVDLGLEAITAPAHPHVVGAAPFPSDAPWWIAGALVATALVAGAVVSKKKKQEQEAAWLGESPLEAARRARGCARPVRWAVDEPRERLSSEAASEAAAAAVARATQGAPGSKKAKAAAKDAPKRELVRTWGVIGFKDGTPVYGDTAEWVERELTAKQKAAAKEQSQREQAMFNKRVDAVNEARKVVGLEPILPPSESASKDPEGWAEFRQSLRDWEARIPRYAGQEQMGRHIPGQDPWHAKSRGQMRCVDDSSTTGQGRMRPSSYFARK